MSHHHIIAARYAARQDFKRTFNVMSLYNHSGIGECGHVTCTARLADAAATGQVLRYEWFMDGMRITEDSLLRSLTVAA